MNIRPITEEDLHAYVDLALDPARKREVEDYLSSHPAEAARVRAYAEQRAGLRAAFAPIADEPIPPELNLIRLVEATRRPKWAVRQMAAASLLFLVLGGAGGWLLHGARPGPAPSGMAMLTQMAMANYDVYGPDQVHPVEFKASQSDEMMGWISSRLNTKLMVPDLSSAGYHFMGGRLVATAHGPAGLLMYDNGQGVRFVMLVKPMEAEKPTKAMAQSVDGNVTGFSWAQNSVGYSVAGAAAPKILHPLANEIRRQISLGI